MTRPQYQFGKQPALFRLREAGYHIGAVARRFDLNESHLRCVLYGSVRPSQEVKVALARLLGVPVTELFTPDALEVPYRHQWNSRVTEDGRLWSGAMC